MIMYVTRCRFKSSNSSPRSEPLAPFPYTDFLGVPLCPVALLFLVSVLLFCARASVSCQCFCPVSNSRVFLPCRCFRPVPHSRTALFNRASFPCQCLRPESVVATIPASHWCVTFAFSRRPLPPANLESYAYQKSRFQNLKNLKILTKILKNNRQNL